MLENSYPIRTDLALESQERLQEDQADMRGIRVLEERRENGVIVSTVMIETENASVAMGRPKGTYITIEAPEMIEEDAGYHRGQRCILIRQQGAYRRLSGILKG